MKLEDGVLPNAERGLKFGGGGVGEGGSADSTGFVKSYKLCHIFWSVILGFRTLNPQNFKHSMKGS